MPAIERNETTLDDGISNGRNASTTVLLQKILSTLGRTGKGSIGLCRPRTEQGAAKQNPSEEEMVRSQRIDLRAVVTVVLIDTGYRAEQSPCAS